jgi:class 3 adenylate cyclase
MQPETKYAQSRAGAIGYQVFGDGPIDIVFNTNWQNNVDLIWDEPSAVRYLDRLGSFARVIFFDKRGTGISDPVAPDNPPTINQWIEDITVVMDEVGSKKAAMIGDTEGGWMAMAYAAFHPERVLSLALINTMASARRAPDYPEGIPQKAAEHITDLYVAQHGTTGDGLLITAPTIADDPRFRRWWIRYQRNSMSPAMLRAGFEWQVGADLRSIVPSISAPTIVISRKDARYHRPAFGKWIADHIEGAEYILLDGADTLPFHAGDFNEVLDHVERFVTGKTTSVESTRRLATVLFTDIVDSTKRASAMGDQRWLDTLAETNQISARQVERFGGEFIHTTGDGHLAIFDGPARAVTTAKEILAEVAGIGIEMRAGIHTGEITVTGNDIAGIAVHIASRVIDHAPNGSIGVSSTVKDLTVGSSLDFEPLGTFTLKGVPGDWTLFKAV